MPIYRHPFYKKKDSIKNFPSSENYYKNCISIPMYAGLSIKNQDKVINILKKNII